MVWQMGDLESVIGTIQSKPIVKICDWFCVCMNENFRKISTTNLTLNIAL